MVVQMELNLQCHDDKVNVDDLHGANHKMDAKKVLVEGHTDFRTKDPVSKNSVRVYWYNCNIRQLLYKPEACVRKYTRDFVDGYLRFRVD